jgi:AAA family ATP:ADP antiporter
MARQDRLKPAALALGRLLGVEPDEGARVAWSCALFFFVFAGWYALRPVRDAMGIAGSAKDLPRLFLVTLGVTLAVSPALSALLSRIPRRRAPHVVYRFLTATLIAFFFALRGAGGSPSPLGARAFFVWASVLNLVEITLAWALMADVFSRAQGVRLFALIGAGGTLGAMFGSLATSIVVARFEAASALLLAAALLECAVRAADGVVASLREEDSGAKVAPARGDALGWLRRALASPFFLAICAYLALFTLTSTVLYLEQGRIVKASLLDTAHRAELFAQMDLAVNTIAFVLQVFVVGRALRVLGVGPALAVLPLATFAFFAAIRAAPTLAVLVGCQVARRALDYALAKPAREVLFTIVKPEDKYKAKSFIDTFVYRSGDALGALGFEGVGGAAIVAGMAGVCLLWAAIGLALGRVRAA